MATDEAMLQSDRKEPQMRLSYYVTLQQQDARQQFELIVATRSNWTKIGTTVKRDSLMHAFQCGKCCSSF
jgi:hypothetical protein